MADSERTPTKAEAIAQMLRGTGGGQPAAPEEWPWPDKHHALHLGDGRILIFAPVFGGHTSVLEVRHKAVSANWSRHDADGAWLDMDTVNRPDDASLGLISIPPVDLSPIADLICRHLDEPAAPSPFPPSHAAWDPNAGDAP